MRRSLPNSLQQHPPALKEYGEGMKAQAGAPQFELYQIFGNVNRVSLASKAI